MESGLLYKKNYFRAVRIDYVYDPILVRNYSRITFQVVKSLFSILGDNVCQAGIHKCMNKRMTSKIHQFTLNFAHDT